MTPPSPSVPARRDGHRSYLFRNKGFVKISAAGVDASGFDLLPGLVKTCAPKGHTPVVHEWPTRDHLSVMSGVTPVGKIYVLVRQESLNGLHAIEFLKHLIRHVGSRLLVIWDGSPIHRRAAVQAFLASAWGGGVRIERLPPYAPDLNPVEGAWPHLKHVEMRNLVCLDWEELHRLLRALARGNLATSVAEEEAIVDLSRHSWNKPVRTNLSLVCSVFGSTSFEGTPGSLPYRDVSGWALEIVGP